GRAREGGSLAGGGLRWHEAADRFDDGEVLLLEHPRRQRRVIVAGQHRDATLHDDLAEIHRLGMHAMDRAAGLRRAGLEHRGVHALAVHAASPKSGSSAGCRLITGTPGSFTKNSGARMW